MNIALQRSLPLTKTFAAAIIIMISYALAATSIVQSQQTHSDRLVAVSADVNLRVIEAGPADAQSIVLIPGWCFTADIWSKQIAALSNRYHVVAIDPRSQGNSTILNHSNSPDDRAADIANLIKKMGLRKPVLVGWSQGVQDVAAYALAFGTDEVGGIVFVDATVSAGAGGLDDKMASIVLGRMPIYGSSTREYFEAMMHYIFKKPLSAGELSPIITAALKTPTSIAIANLMLDMFGKDYTQAFKRISVPTLIIVAGTAPDKALQLQQPIPNATTAVVDSAGHAVFYDEPAKFNDALTQFLEKNQKAKQSDRGYTFMESKKFDIKMHNVGIVFEDLKAAVAFFVELGLELEVETQVEGKWVDHVIGLTDARVDVVMMRTPDGHNRLELMKFQKPTAVDAGQKNAPANALGLRRIMFAVEDIEDVLARLQTHGAKLVGKLEQYEDKYRLCYVRGPEGIIVALAEQLN